ncbi:hypothetical protein HMPREF9709_01799 [Helcococcus kunzii ATCC 51366]|uniref:Type I restriction modification DNA specificity domain-containing protein n=1 Tax=Helcococcus kunzii ATCC 51366 TaxID=883114 RepID=H3NR38_9FIRM|nr:restriction endonuclease subunit S [Helcococcus kunzii]EHR31843.1 hypothetical protein HMPREF9709_01799 [Helcococcus kunzii ATCC 51366]
MDYSWNTVKVSDLGTIITGKTPRTKEKQNYGGEIPFLTPSDDMDSRYVTKTERSLSIIGEDSVKKQVIPAGSICVSCIGSQLGKVTMTTKKTVTNQQINSIIPNKNYNPLFIYYSMLLIGKKLNFISKTSTAVPIVNKTDFSNMELMVPNIQIQNKIVNILSYLDQKIEVNNKIIANLESQAQAIFKSWFVDFEPFQDGEFVESELGMIPKGWEVTTIGEISKRINGYSYKSSDLADVSKYNMVTLKNFNRNGDMPNDVIKPISLNDRIKYRHFLLENDILVACTDLTQAAEVIGRVLLYSMNEKFDNEIFSMDLVKLVPNSELERLFLYYYLKSPMFKDYAEGVATGTTVLHLPKNAIDNFTVVRPNLYGIELFNKTISPFIELQKVLYKQNQKLAETRDTLLPKLMSGEIDVSNIKIDIEEDNND